MKNRTKGKMITAYQQMVDRMKLLALGLKTSLFGKQVLRKFKECITKNGITHKLVPSPCHRCNIVKQAIQLFKKPCHLYP